MHHRHRHTGIHGEIRRCSAPRRPGLRHVSEILQPLLARLAAQQFADRSVAGDMVGTLAHGLALKRPADQHAEADQAKRNGGDQEIGEVVVGEANARHG